MTPRPGAIVLDLDGTLVDSAPELARAANAALEPLGRRRLGVDEVRAMIGDGIPALAERALAATGAVPTGAAFEAVLADLRRHYDAEAPSGMFPGVPETVAALKRRGHALGVCTNKPQGPAERLLAALGLGAHLDAVAGGDAFAVKKPDPGHVTGLLSRMGADAAGAVMVGDGGPDAAAARGAGLRFVAAAYGYHRGPLADLGADAVIGSFAELPAVLDRLRTSCPAVRP